MSDINSIKCEECNVVLGYSDDPSSLQAEIYCEECWNKKVERENL